jgi:chemotaxis protein histidine kinase CheA
MKEIVVDFCNESLELFAQLEECLEKMEDDPSETTELEKFGQIIDRVMGAAKSIGADDIATFCELGKVIGYKSSQIKDTALIEVVTAILFDSVELLNKMVNGLKNGTEESTKSVCTSTFITRLNWLKDKFNDIERASCAMDPGKDAQDNLSQGSIDDLMSSLGL